MDNFRSIIVAIDLGSDGLAPESCRGALARAAHLAERHGAALSLVHVIDLPPEGAARWLGRGDDAIEQARRAAEAAVRTLAEELGIAGAFINIRVGEAWRLLIKEVIREQHDLIVLGTRNRGMVGRALFGSVGRRLLHYCPCPVWVVKGADGPAFRDVLVAHDLTEVGQQALELAVAMAALDDARLHVLHVIEHREQQDFLGSVTQAELRARETQKQSELQAACEQAGARDPQLRVGSGSPQAEILDYLGRVDIDLVCMGTVARSGLSGIVTGNTAENVLPWIDASLLAVKPAGFRYPDFND